MKYTMKNHLDFVLRISTAQGFLLTSTMMDFVIVGQWHPVTPSSGGCYGWLLSPPGVHPAEE